MTRSPEYTSYIQSVNWRNKSNSVLSRNNKQTMCAISVETSNTRAPFALQEFE